jgi:hypothetical protein
VRALLAVAAALLLAVPAAAARAPFLPAGRAIALYTPTHPTVILFGDSVSLDLTVVVDRRLIDPATVVVHPSLAPFTVTGPRRFARRDIGEITELRLPLLLRCITYPCVPTGQTTLQHLRRADVVYRLRGKRGERQLRLRLPAIEVISQINPTLVSGETNTPLQVRITPYVAHFVPLPRPTYRIEPAVLIGGTFGASGLFAAIAGTLLVLAVRRRRLPREPAPGAELKRALELLAWAREHGDETDRRKAIERVAAELGPNGATAELAARARELAWAEPSPPGDDVDRLADRVRKEVHP